MDIRERIDILRQERGWTKVDLAREAGVSYTAIKNWYNDKDSMPSFRVIDELCVAFNISKAQLFTDIKEDKLRDDQIAVLELYEILPDKKRRAIIEIMRNMID